MTGTADAGSGSLAAMHDLKILAVSAPYLSSALSSSDHIRSKMRWKY
jgi:hypothetical protein